MTARKRRTVRVRPWARPRGALLASPPMPSQTLARRAAHPASRAAGDRAGAAGRHLAVVRRRTR
ncbi:MAG: hypothetical protein MZW92_47130 [Comamonadaceae bacterium]|nr:hypothetical protein [Comamonadaceae bacterium]